MVVKPSAFRFEIDIPGDVRKIEQAIDAAIEANDYTIDSPTPNVPRRWVISGLARTSSLTALDLAVPSVRKLYQNAGWDDLVVTIMGEGLYFRLFYTESSVSDQNERAFTRR